MPDIPHALPPFLRHNAKPQQKSSASITGRFGESMFQGSAEDESASWFSRAYWAAYRFFKYKRPARICNEIRNALQRSRRGWADSDTYDLRGYLDLWMPDALRYLKTHKHGVPRDMFKAEDLICPGDWRSGSSDEGLERAEARWNATLDKMIAAFEASRRIEEQLYEEELGDYPTRRPEGVSMDAWEALTEKRRQDVHRLVERDQQIFKEGMELFVTHYHSLWD